jgi:hypothetical protein
MARLAVLLVVGALGLALPATALGVAAFRTPKKAAYCGLTEGEGPPYRPTSGRSVARGAVVLRVATLAD